MNKKINVRALLFVALMSALISLTAMISIPSPIPFTLQTFGVFFALFFLGGRLGSLSVLLYICIGALGIPVFSGFGGGIARLFDVGGGYIIGFLVGALLYWLLVAVLPKAAHFKILSSAIAMLSIYLTGTVWYFAVYLDGVGGIGAVLFATVLPFVIPDILKIALAYFLSKRLQRIIKI